MTGARPPPPPLPKSPWASSSGLVRADSEASARVVRLGAMADTWIGEQLRHCVSRAEAVRRIVDRLKAEGIRGEMLRVNRIVAISWVARLFGYRQAKLLPVSTLRALLPLIKRQPRTGLWEIRKRVAGRAEALWARIGAERLSAAAVREAVKDLRPPRVAPPSRRRSARILILRRLADLNIDDLAYIASACQEKLRAIGAKPGRLAGCGKGSAAPFSPLSRARRAERPGVRGLGSGEEFSRQGAETRRQGKR